MMDADALLYHKQDRPGKIAIQLTKPCRTERELSLAYTPGVAIPCREIAKDPQKAYDYTSKGNLVAVITNGTAVLGLGNIGPLAGKPVMEGKAILFKQFADIDVFDIELDADDPTVFIASVKALAPTFGGINLEDIKAPECFVVEEELKRQLNMPVFHDDQHGTAIVVSAALINAVLLTNRKMDDVKVVFSGAGAAAIACARLFVELGVSKSNIIMCDIHGVVYEGRTIEMDRFKAEFAASADRRTLKEALVGADVLVGLSAGNVVTPPMLEKMADSPVIFALANPEPEINPKLAREVRPDSIIATGRSDVPNQINNVLGFPSIFRGALDVQATSITNEMKMAAVHALALLARESVPEGVSNAYGKRSFSFGPDYLLPKPFDPRVLLTVAPAVAKAAIESKVARKPIVDFGAYQDRLEAIQGLRKSFIRSVIHSVQLHDQNATAVPRIIFSDGSDERVLKAADFMTEEQIAHPIFVGSPREIQKAIDQLGLKRFFNAEIVNPIESPCYVDYVDYVESLYHSRNRKGITYQEAERLAKDHQYFSALAVIRGDADGMIGGLSGDFANCVRPLLEIIGTGQERLASGLNILLFKGKILFFADTAINLSPSADDLATIAIHSSMVAEYFGVTPKIAMVSYSNFVSKTEISKKMRLAAEMVKGRCPEILVDGEMQADTAIDKQISGSIFPFCGLAGDANILIFPNLESGNIAYKLLQKLGGREVLGPFIMGLRRPANIVTRTCTSEDIFNTAVITAHQIHAYFDNAKLASQFKHETNANTCPPIASTRI